MGWLHAHEAKALVALFSLDSEFNNGGLIQYLMNESADSWQQVREAIEVGELSSGLAWMKSVEQVLGGAVSPDRDTRLDVISSMDAYKEGLDPFDGPDAALREGLLDDLQQVGEMLAALCRERLQTIGQSR
ncbi:MAG: DUF4375 domain-containing protein [Burkholderiales bacterium]|nr:DUF4375 domain-containing protein [Burkholderiales bacterium]